MNLKQLEENAVGALRDVLGKAAAAEPTVAEVIGAALEGAGVPAGLVETAKGLVTGLLGHWQAEHAPAAPAAPEPAADPFPLDPTPGSAEPSDTAGTSEPPKQNYV